MDNNDKLSDHSVRAKRRRTANYTCTEKQIILNLVRRYVHIIEKKKTDTATCREKELCWKQITDEFNAQPGINVLRSTESLKHWFENQKKKIRKRFTLGSNPCTEKDFVNNLLLGDETKTLSIASDDSLLVEDNLVDSSADVVAIKSENEELEELIIEENDINLLKDENIRSDSETYFLVAEEESPPPQLPSQNGLLEKTKKTDKFKPWPYKKALVPHLSSLSKHHNYKLNTVKLKIAQFELETLKTISRIKEEQEKKQHDLKMRSLQLDIDIKQELLNKIKEAKPSECLQNVLLGNFVTNNSVI